MGMSKISKRGCRKGGILGKEASVIKYLSIPESCWELIMGCNYDPVDKCLAKTNTRLSALFRQINFGRIGQDYYP